MLWQFEILHLHFYVAVCMCELLFVIFAGDVTYLILVDIAKQLQPSYFCSVDLVICSCIFVVLVLL